MQHMKKWQIRFLFLLLSCVLLASCTEIDNIASSMPAAAGSTVQAVLSDDRTSAGERSDDAAAESSPDQESSPTDTSISGDDPMSAFTEEQKDIFLLCYHDCILSSCRIQDPSQPLLLSEVPKLFTEADRLAAYLRYQNRDEQALLEQLDAIEAKWNWSAREQHAKARTLAEQLSGHWLMRVARTGGMLEHYEIVYYEYPELGNLEFHMITEIRLLRDNQTYSLQQVREQRLVDWDALCQQIPSDQLEPWESW